MAIIKSMRNVTIQEFLNRLEQKKTTGPKNVIWIEEKGERIVEKVFSVTESGKVIKITAPYKFCREVLPGSTLFFRLDIGNIIVKMDVEQIREGTKIIAYPTKIKADELRSSPRTTYPYLKQVKVKFYVTKGYNDSKKFFQTTMLNISSGGMGLFLEPLIQKKIEKDEKIYITSIGNVEIKKPIEATVRHKKSKTVDSARDSIEGTLFGVQFESLKDCKEYIEQFTAP